MSCSAGFLIFLWLLAALAAAVVVAGLAAAGGWKASQRLQAWRQRQRILVRLCSISLPDVGQGKHDAVVWRIGRAPESCIRGI